MDPSGSRCAGRHPRRREDGRSAGGASAVLRRGSSPPHGSGATLRTPGRRDRRGLRPGPDPSASSRGGFVRKRQRDHAGTIAVMTTDSASGRDEPTDESTGGPAPKPPRARWGADFEPDRLALLELRMWKAYYRRQPARLFGTLVMGLREQAHVGRPRAFVAAVF